MSNDFLQQRKQAISVALQENPKLKNAKIKVEPINGSGDYMITARKTTRGKFGEFVEVEGVIKRDQSLDHLKLIFQ